MDYVDSIATIVTNETKNTDPVKNNISLGEKKILTVFTTEQQSEAVNRSFVCISFNGKYFYFLSSSSGFILFKFSLCL